ncbi:NUDIX hydrolase [Streptomyces hygroscopicus]|uniref:NUDIX hydrolase n=1 Tax=Streptomyces hygroscopicus TaxID=1912 RepID=UPI00382F2A7C
MTDQPTTEQPGISAAIILHEDRVLMVRRAVKEGELMWQFPAGGIEPGETAEQAAVRETAEETGLTVEAIKLIGERVHPKTGRLMSYTACSLIEGEAHVADEEELDAVAWVTHGEIPEYVPYGLYERVQEYLDDAIGGGVAEREADRAQD